MERTRTGVSEAGQFWGSLQDAGSGPQQTLLEGQTHSMSLLDSVPNHSFEDSGTIWDAEPSHITPLKAAEPAAATAAPARPQGPLRLGSAGQRAGSGQQLGRQSRPAPLQTLAPAAPPAEEPLLIDLIDFGAGQTFQMPVTPRSGPSTPQGRQHQHLPSSASLSSPIMQRSAAPETKAAGKPPTPVPMLRPPPKVTGLFLLRHVKPVAVAGEGLLPQRPARRCSQPCSSLLHMQRCSIQWCRLEGWYHC